MVTATPANKISGSFVCLSFWPKEVDRLPRVIAIESSSQKADYTILSPGHFAPTGNGYRSSFAIPMAKSAALAIGRELKQYQDAEDLQFTIDRVNDDLFNLRVGLSGPEGSPYEEGLFFLALTVPQNYPNVIPDIKFVTKIYHPNVTEEGKICLDDLKSTWKSTDTLKEAVGFIIMLMLNPNWDHPLVPAIGHQHAENPDEFVTTARQWTTTYAI
jgi:ubiquitin-conjugating enzyme E2 D/E